MRKTLYRKKTFSTYTILCLWGYKWFYVLICFRSSAYPNFNTSWSHCNFVSNTFLNISTISILLLKWQLCRNGIYGIDFDNSNTFLQYLKFYFTLHTIINWVTRLIVNNSTTTWKLPTSQNLTIDGSSHLSLNWFFSFEVCGNFYPNPLQYLF